MRRWIFIAALVLLLGWVVLKTDALPGLVDIVDRGRRLSVDDEDGSGVVTTSDADLLAQATAVVGREVTFDAYAAARMVRSEEGAAGQVAKVFLVHVMLNQAAALGMSLAEVIELHTNSKRAGHFGQQISGRVASDDDPYESDLAAAEYAIAQRAQGEDPTAGATNFVDRRAFGVQEGTGSFADLVDRWSGDGKVPGTLPGTSDNLVFFWRGGVPTSVGAVEVTA